MKEIIRVIIKFRRILVHFFVVMNKLHCEFVSLAWLLKFVCADII